MNLRWITHLDTFPVMARLMKLNPPAWRPVEARGETNDPMIGLGASLLLRAHNNITKANWLDDLPIAENSELAQWPSMKRLLDRGRKAIMAESVSRQCLSGKMGRAMISRLDAGSTIFWHVDDGPYHEKHVRFHVPLVTNPGCIMYSGPQSQHLEVGSLWYFNNRVRHSAANWGAHYRLHLVFEMRRIEADDVEESR